MYIQREREREYERETETKIKAGIEGERGREQSVCLQIGAVKTIKITNLIKS